MKYEWFRQGPATHTKSEGMAPKALGICYVQKFGFALGHRLLVVRAIQGQFLQKLTIAGFQDSEEGHRIRNFLVVNYVVGTI
jgi:hypothetical protein